jgi:DMSO/TMAO reductase YedYZ molybdopterin-dependent catalytic subunit
MSHQGPGRHRPPADDRGGVPWPGNQPDVRDYPAGYSELLGYRREGYPDYAGYPDYQASQVSEASQGYQAPPQEYQASQGYQRSQGYQSSQGNQTSQEYQAPGGYRTSAVITEPPAYPGPVSDEFATPVINPAPVDSPPASDGDEDPTAYVGLAPPGPGRVPTPGAWRRRGRGLLAGMTTGLLAAAVAITVATLAAALLRPQASPVSAVARMLRSAAMTSFAARHLGAREHIILLTLAWLAVAAVAMTFGLIARRRRAAGVIGMTAVFGAAAAFSVLARPGSQAADVVPSLLGGLAGAIALALLASAAAPQVVLARAVTRVRGGYQRTGELDVVGTNRRRFLLASLSVTAVAAAAGVSGRLLMRKGVTVAPPEVAGPVQKLPALPASARLDNIAGISPFYTPDGRFYRVDTALVVPRVTTQGWKLRVHGMVDKPIEINYEDLLSRPQLQRDITIVCVSEAVGGGYVGNARWQGARLADLLREAGVQPGASQIVMRDVHGMAIGVSTEAVMDGRDALLAVKMNGQPLPAEHGYPVRVVVPGLYGYVSACKWVVDMELTTYAAYDAYWSKRGWTAQAAVKTESRIDTPKATKPLTAGQVVVAGVAWATHKGIAKVEVGVDGVWAEATLATQDTIDTWRQWYYRWDAAPGPHTLQVRATDRTGYTQTAAVHGPPPNGATGYHTVKVTVA